METQNKEDDELITRLKKIEERAKGHISKLEQKSLNEIKAIRVPPPQLNFVLKSLYVLFVRNVKT